MNSRDRADSHPPGATGTTGPGSGELNQSFDASTLVALRSAVAAHSADLGLSDVQVDNMVLVAHELATNAVRHAGGAGRLRLWRADGTVFCQVSDDGPGFATPETVGLHRPGPYQTGGRGVWIARQLSNALHVRTTARGTTVTAVMGVREP